MTIRLNFVLQIQNFNSKEDESRSVILFRIYKRAQGNMRILAISDIHENVEAMRRLRWLETNRFDAVFIAGDLGNKSASEIIRIAATFFCPVFYVLGNHDYEIEYDDKVLSPAIHIHNGPVFLDKYCIVGYSGCNEQWGKNPIGLEVDNEFSTLSEKNKTVINKYNELQKHAFDFFTRTGLTCGAADQKLNRLKSSRDWKRYNLEYKILEKSIVKRNVEHAISHSKESGIEQKKTIFISHARTYKLQDELPDLRLHMFGHHHGFKDSTRKNTRFINVSVLDDTRTVRLVNEEIDRLTIAEAVKLPLFNYGTYTIIEINKGSEIETHSIRLWPEDSHYVPLRIRSPGQRTLHLESELWNG